MMNISCFLSSFLVQTDVEEDCNPHYLIMGPLNCKSGPRWSNCWSLSGQMVLLLNESINRDLPLLLFLLKAARMGFNTDITTAKLQKTEAHFKEKLERKENSVMMLLTSVEFMNGTNRQRVYFGWCFVKWRSVSV